MSLSFPSLLRKVMFALSYFGFRVRFRNIENRYKKVLSF
jgi:hypothetical protein